jgi:hypothetical protein
VTGEPATLSEARDVSHVLKLTRAQVGNLRLVVFGRGSAEAERALRRELEGSGIEALVLCLPLPEDLTGSILMRMRSYLSAEVCRAAAAAPRRALPCQRRSGCGLPLRGDGIRRVSIFYPTGFPPWN